MGLETCECKCEDGFIVLTGAGTIPGNDFDSHDGSCDVAVSYLCGGSPEIPSTITGPALSFVRGASDNCDEDDSFTAVVLHFYTPLPPGPAMTHQIVLVVVLPLCDCTVGANDRTCGTFKSLDLVR